MAGPRAGQRRRCGPAPSSSTGSTGSAVITLSHLGHSVLPIWIATGLPWVRPWRTPADEGDLVLLELHARAAAVAELGAGPASRRCRPSSPRTWAGSPSRIATREGPWDSPCGEPTQHGQVFHGRFARTSAVTRRRDRPDLGPAAISGERSDQQERPERVRRLSARPVAAHQRHQEARAGRTPGTRRTSPITSSAQPGA